MRLKIFRQTKNNAELNALRTINSDLKDQISKLEHDLDFASGPTDTHNIKNGLEEKYKSAKSDFNSFIAEAELGKKQVENELAELRKKVSMKKNENSSIQKDINDNENEINRLNTEIGKLSKEIELLKKRNEESIRVLEQERGKSSDELVELKKKAAEVEHEWAKLRILLEKTRNEMDYLNSEKDKAKGQGFQKKIEEFSKWIDESEKKAKVLREELGNLNTEWRERVSQSSKLASSTVMQLDGAETAKRIDELNKELAAKNRELEELRVQKATMERELLNDGSALDEQIQKQRDELDELNRKYLASLEEKNTIFEELSDQAKRLLAFNDSIQKNVEQIAIQRQEIEFLKKVLEQKTKLVDNFVYEIESRRNLIMELREEIALKNQIIDELEKPRDEIETIEMLIREKDDIIRELEAQIRERTKRISKPVIKETIKVQSSTKFSVEKGDRVDEMIADFLDHNEWPVPVSKISEGYYMFGTRKIYAKIMNDQLVVRVGGGYMSISEFIEAYGQTEYDKIEAKRAKGQDPFEDTIRSGESSGSPKRT